MHNRKIDNSFPILTLFLFSFLSVCLYRKETGYQGRKPERKINVFTQTNEAEKDKEKTQMVRFDEIYEQRTKIKPSYEAQKRLI